MTINNSTQPKNFPFNSEIKKRLNASMESINRTVNSINLTPLRKMLHKHIVKPKIIILTLISVLFLISSLFLGVYMIQKKQEIRSQASNSGPELSISPKEGNISVNQELNLDILLNTNADTVTATQLELSYDTTALDFVSFIPSGSVIPIVLAAPTAADGKITVVLGAQPDNPFKGSGIIGTLKVKGKSAKQSTIAFTNSSIVTAIEKTTNALTTKVGAQITATENNSITPTSTSKSTPTSTPTSTSKSTPIPTQVTQEYHNPNNNQNQINRTDTPRQTPIIFPSSDQTIDTGSQLLDQDNSPFIAKATKQYIIRIKSVWTSILDFILSIPQLIINSFNQ